MADNERCRWCTSSSGKTDLDFAVVDDNSGWFIPGRMIEFCPFCGRKLRCGADG